MFDDMDVHELCRAIEEAFYKGFNEHASTLCLELKERIENTFVSNNDLDFTKQG